MFIKNHILLVACVLFLAIGGTVFASNRIDYLTSIQNHGNGTLTPTTPTSSPILTDTPEVIVKEVPVYVFSSPVPDTYQTTSQQTDNSALCEAKKEQMAGAMAESINSAEAKLEINAQEQGSLFYQSWLNMKPNVELMAKDWSIKTLGEYETYCLTHNGDDAGWKPSSGPFDSIKW